MLSPTIDVAVVGASNVDLVVRVPSLPMAGETVFASPLQILPGGKGLNQAIAVVRFGGTAALVSRVGDDPWGQQLQDALVNVGVDTTATSRVKGSATAAAIIHVPPSGDSAVTLARTLDCLPTLSDLDTASAVLTRAAVTVVQLELAPAVVDRSIALATGEIIGTLAPHRLLPTATLGHLDVLVVNAAEAATMLGTTGQDVSGNPVQAARAVAQMGPSMVVVTLGSAGAAYASHDTSGTTAAPAVPVIDTAGAGDAALAAFALARARSKPFPEAVAAAVNAGSTAVQQVGAALAVRPPGASP